MAINRNKQKRLSGATIERRHVAFLVSCIYASMAVMIFVIVLQIIGLSSAPVTQTEDLFGTAKPAFVWSPFTVSVFLIIPSVLLTTGWIYLKRYFIRNAHGSYIVIPYLENTPRRRITKYLNYTFALLNSLICLILAIISFVRLGQSESEGLTARLAAFIPFLSMCFAVVAFLMLTNLMRLRRRTYSHQRRVQKEAKKKDAGNSQAAPQ